MPSIVAQRPKATWVPKGGLVKGGRAIKIDITGLKELQRVFGGAMPLYNNALEKVVKRSISVGEKRVQAQVPERSGGLSGPLASRYWNFKGPKRPQMGSVSAGAGIGAKGFRYGWALNYGRQIVRTASRTPDGKPPKSTPHGYMYSKRGRGVSTSRAGQPTYGWMSKAARSMASVIRRDLNKAVGDIEHDFARRTRPGSTP